MYLFLSLSFYAHNNRERLFALVSENQTTIGIYYSAAFMTLLFTQFNLIYKDYRQR